MFQENKARQISEKRTFLTPWYAHVFCLIIDELKSIKMPGLKSKNVDIPAQMLNFKCWTSNETISRLETGQSPFPKNVFGRLLLLRQSPSFSSCTNQWNSPCSSLLVKKSRTQNRVLNVFHDNFSFFYVFYSKLDLVILFPLCHPSSFVFLLKKRF